MSNGLVVSDIERRRRECRIRNEASRIRGNDACGHGYPNWYSRVAMCEGLTKSGYVQTGLTAPKHRRTCCALGETSAPPLPLWRHPTQPVGYDPFATIHSRRPVTTARSTRPVRHDRRRESLAPLPPHRPIGPLLCLTWPFWRRPVFADGRGGSRSPTAVALLLAPPLC